MRFSRFVPAVAGVSLFFSCACLSLPAFAQNFGDVTVKKNPDGSIETYDSSEAASAAPRRQSHSSYKKSTHKYHDGVVVRKNADGSIETFDSGDGNPSPRRSSAVGSSSHRSVNKYRDGVVVKKNADGSIETSDSGDVVTHHGSRGSSGGATHSGGRSSSAVNKFVHKYPKGVTIKKNPDGTIEVIGDKSDLGKTSESADLKSKQKSHFSAKAGSPTLTGSSAKSSSVKSSTKSSPSAKSSAPKAKSRTARRPRGHGNYGDVKVIRNPDGSIETYDAN